MCLVHCEHVDVAGYCPWCDAWYAKCSLWHGDIYAFWYCYNMSSCGLCLLCAVRCSLDESSYWILRPQIIGGTRIKFNCRGVSCSRMLTLDQHRHFAAFAGNIAKFRLLKRIKWLYAVQDACKRYFGVPMRYCRWERVARFSTDRKQVHNIRSQFYTVQNMRVDDTLPFTIHYCSVNRKSW